MPPVHDEAICIRQWDWSETSQTLSLFCRDLGLVRGLAKGSRRPKAPYSGGIEILTRGQVGVISRQGSEMALITEWDLAEQFPALRRSLQAHYAGMYMAELVLHAVHDHDPHPALYTSLLEGLRVLDDEGSRRLALLNYQWAVLVETGYRPEVMEDVSAGTPLAEAATYRFSPSLGGIVGASGAGDAGATWGVRRETVELLRRLPARDPGEQAREAVDRAGSLLAAYLRYVLGREPRMLPYLYDRQLPR